MKLKSTLAISLLLIFSTFSSLETFSQGLSLERVTKIKNSTVRITIENDGHQGSGFFVSSIGTIATCWHVIEPSIIRDSNTKAIIGFKKIFATTNTGEKIEIGIAAKIFQDTAFLNNSIANDFCILYPILRLKKSAPFLFIGNFDTVNDGDDIYACGYPKELLYPFISKGIVSTKFLDTTNSIIQNGHKIKKNRNLAYLDLTLNGGNSGGPIIKIGVDANHDEVIGIADFIINPMGRNSQDLVDLLKQRSGGIFLGGVDPNLLFSTIIDVLDNTSTGISGCVSINYFSEVYSKL
ncbi:trypsin-like peptidase domain-containing protein [Inquilinus sp. KBS0705]|nr:trypsin-like peptidase domain-containing protein [Inquilinus sp. KBS0705]